MTLHALRWLRDRVSAVALWLAWRVDQLERGNRHEQRGLHRG